MAIPRGSVLVVEDDSDIRGLLVEALQDDGYRVVAVADGDLAIATLQGTAAPADQFCIVLLDLMLPSGSGLQVLDHLHRSQSTLPVIAMSASARHLAEARRAGAHFAVEKPFELQAIVTLIERACHLP
jgi:CheY-like chemotaxis protein